ncbi:MAG: bacteriocin [Peptostreptococcaceae bacterium]|nr:bacteriocin [Peptostreptococcaceae bacterium]
MPKEKKILDDHELDEKQLDEVSGGVDCGPSNLLLNTIEISH